jgi:hypothetical protein
MTNAERQRRYIARLKKAAVSNGGDAGLAKELAQAKAKIASLKTSWRGPSLGSSWRRRG